MHELHPVIAFSLAAGILFLANAIAQRIRQGLMLLDFCTTGGATLAEAREALELRIPPGKARNELEFQALLRNARNIARELAMPWPPPPLYPRHC